MKSIQFSAFTLLLLALISCGDSTKETKENEQEWKTLSEKNYTIHYPGNWELDQSNKMGMSFMVSSPALSDSDKIRENVNLLIQDLPKDMNLEKFVQISENQIKTTIPNSSIIESTRELSGEFEYHKILYTGNEREGKFKFEQHYFVKKGKAYILTLTCEQDQFDQYQDVGEKVLNSFRFL